MRVKSQWKRASIFNPDNGDVVQINKVAVEFSDMTKTPIKTESTNGAVFGGYECELTLGMLKADGLDQLEQWLNSNTNLHVAIEGQMNVLWLVGAEGMFQRGVGVNARDGVQIHQMILAKVGGTPEIYPTVNLAVPFGVSGGASDNREIPFPVVGAVITASADTGDPFDLVVRDSDGTPIATASSTSVGGRQQATVTLTGSSYSVTFEPGGSYTELSIRTDGSYEFVNA